MREKILIVHFKLKILESNLLLIPFAETCVLSAHYDGDNGDGDDDD